MTRPLISLLSLLALGACGDDVDESRAALALATVAATPVAMVQGNSDSSPLLEQTVTVVGIVTGDFQNNDADETRNLGGFFLQSEAPDDDPDTSDGIFIFDGDAADVDVVVGQRVQVTGTVTEWFNETQIIPDGVAITGTAAAEPVPLRFTAATTQSSDGMLIADFERYEGMLVQLSDPAIVSENYSLERFGELTLVSGDRPWQFTNTNNPDAANYAAHVAQLAARTLILDDGLTEQNPRDYRLLMRASVTGETSVRLGDRVVATGNIRYSRGSGNSGIESYRLVPTAEPEFISGNPRPSEPPDTGGAVTVASFNLLNYFTTLDAGRDVCGPDGGMNCRGADSTVEFERQQAKTINALLALNADIVGLVELENNGGDSLKNLVDGLNAQLGETTWAHIESGHIGSDAIAVGLIYKTAVVEPAGDFALLTSSIDSRFNDLKNRPTLLQTFDVLESGGRFSVAVNHLKSKGSDCDSEGDANRNDGQGNCNRTRATAAAAMGDWLNADPTNSGDSDILIIGDLNSYLQEDPLVALENAGFVNLLRKYVGTEAYSFVFGAQAGALDHAFASRTMAAQVTGAAEWHINADEAPLIDYNLDFGRDAGLFDDATPFRASDHDPVIVGINP